MISYANAHLIEIPRLNYPKKALKIHEETQRNSVSVVLYVIKFHINLDKFSFDFLGLDNVHFQNYFANKLINMGRLLSFLKHL